MSNIEINFPENTSNTVISDTLKWVCDILRNTGTWIHIKWDDSTNQKAREILEKIHEFNKIPKAIENFHQLLKLWTSNDDSFRIFYQEFNISSISDIVYALHNNFTDIENTKGIWVATIRELFRVVSNTNEYKKLPSIGSPEDITNVLGDKITRFLTKKWKNIICTRYPRSINELREFITKWVQIEPGKIQNIISK